jgi:serine protease Do
MKTLKLLIVILFLNTSCSTVLFSTKERVRVTSSIQGVNLELNGEVIERNADSVCFINLPKTNVKNELKISKEGYESQTFPFNLVSRKAAKTFDILGLVAGGGLLITGAALSQNPIPIEAAKASPILAIGAALFIPTLVDLATCSPNTFGHTAVSFDLIPIVPKVIEQNNESILCTSVNVKILPGTAIGNSYAIRDGQFGFIKNYTWEETSNLSVEDLTVLTNNTFSDFGYLVPGLKNKFKENDNYSRFNVKAEIKKLEADAYELTSSSKKTTDINVRTEIIWSIYDNRKKEVVFEKSIKTTMWGHDASARLVVFNAVTNSIKKLMLDQDFNKLLIKTNKGVIENNTKEAMVSSEKISLEPVKKYEKISDLVESAITIELGEGHGSGVIVSSSGYALTNAHVVKDQKSVNIILNTGINLTAEVLKVDEDVDIALIKLPGKGYKCAKINLEEVVIGGDVIAIGTPGKIELGQSLSKGIISGKREIENNIFIQTDVSISPGNSGGPLFDSNKELIGIVCAKLIGTGVEGVGFAIPIGVIAKKFGLDVK